MNQKCNKLGHDQKPMEYFCIQQKQILWSCEKCYKENKQKLNFQSIKHFQSCIQGAKETIIKETENGRIEQMKFEFDMQVQKLKDLLEFYLSGIENQINNQYAELSGIIQFVDNFNIKSLDSPNQDHFQYLHLVLDQSVAKKFDQLQMQINQFMQKILSIGMDIDEQVGFLSESIFLDQMKSLIKKFDLPYQFQKQIEELQIPKQYCLDQSHHAQFVFKEKIDGNTSYIGQQENDEFNGKGLLYLSNKGYVYYGAFINGQFCYGISLNVIKKELLLGEFEFIDLFYYQIQNYGILFNSNCERQTVICNPRYEGDFKDSLFDGYGQFHYQNGDLYKGYWKAGKRFGQGELINQEFGTIKGNFVDGQLNGKGELDCKTQKYVGDFKDNEMDGQGTLEDLDKKTKYVGSFKKGVRCGKGTMFFSDNRKIEGNFLNNEPSGQCVETTTKKYVENLKQQVETTVEEGEYSNGLKCGQFNCQTTYNGQTMKKLKYYDSGELIIEDLIS
ncbi:unnamed protein product (macronuclear) [Paramecium tetraurelia]|uniref:MORN repeat protein n=1 Tax=Paramecium tetraurelia TaxID=5888 RepID=A0E6U4_PARTE|nr:uncharacterized protein GSPATT00023739001 [Paramecium tetraurelia]CAK91011.1 unnamed protein product [Paramecium tetraurelia]|eukprot:XP_001458408.1 hypothetical protein (macronuclear) [Paramecium tetraurelia strain d4-2]